MFDDKILKHRQALKKPTVMKYNSMDLLLRQVRKHQLSNHLCCLNRKQHKKMSQSSKFNQKKNDLRSKCSKLTRSGATCFVKLAFILMSYFMKCLNHLPLGPNGKRQKIT